MADNTTLSAAVGTGDVIITEDTGTGKLPVTGIVTGAHGVNGGRVTVTNPLFVELTDGTAALGVTARPVRVDPTGTTTQPVSMAAAPTGAALDATLTGGTAKAQVIYPASTWYVPTPASLASGVAKAGAGNLKSLAIVNRNVSARYLQLFNSTSAPAGAAAAMAEFLVPAGFMTVLGSDFFTDAGVAFSTGIAWGISSTSVTFTAATAADHDITMVVV